jgi:hypothetical protein
VAPLPLPRLRPLLTPLPVALPPLLRLPLPPLRLLPPPTPPRLTLPLRLLPLPRPSNTRGNSAFAEIKAGRKPGFFSPVFPAHRRCAEQRLFIEERGVKALPAAYAGKSW